VQRLVAVLMMLGLPMGAPSAGLPPIRTVFIILMENHNWSSIAGSADAPYLNGTLLPMAAYCEQYYNPPGLHPSLPNYLWLEAGTNFGIFDDNPPSIDHQNITNHLVTLLENAGVSWKTYQEDISGTYVPLTATNRYTPRHNPFVYFDHVTGTNNANSQYGIAHIRPYGELAADLANSTVARYNFITPNLCDDMHDSCSPLTNAIRQGDNWLASEVPRILGSQAYRDGGALFIVWDEAAAGDGPIGMMVLSPLARGGGYFNNIHYTHGSTLRTMQEIFGVGPLLGDAANQTDLSDLFTPYGFSSIIRLADGRVELTATGVVPGRTNVVEESADLAAWAPISTNSVPANTFTFVDFGATNAPVRYYRLVEAR
jgi:phosphatidylinositol-3-phosphatase